MMIGKLLLTLGVITASAVTGGTVYVMQHKQDQQEEKKETVFPTGKTEVPDNFFATLPEKPKPVPVVIPIMPEPVPIIMPDPMAMAREQKRQEEEAFIQEINRRRLQGGKVRAVNYKQDGEGGEEVSMHEVQVLSADKDFSANEEPRTEPTYPVNLERVITQNMVINAVLESEIRSDLSSSNVVAKVDRDITGATGRNILMPAGSFIIGKYEPLKKQGDSRLAINFYRIITPDGIDIKLSSEGTDVKGSAGLTGEVDNRTKERYGVAALIGTINAAAQLTIPTDSDQARYAANAFSQPMGQVTSQLLQKSFELEPRVRIKQGTLVVISPLTDIWFKEPKDNKYEAVALSTPVQEE